jgi:CBS domain containing-hemolysin-like protein
MKVFWPFIALLNSMGRHFVSLFGLYAPSRHSLVHSEEELKMLVTASQEAGVLEEEEEQMLHRVFGFADLTAGQVMVPRTELVAIRADAPAEEVIDRVAGARHTRLPVYRGDAYDVVGILYVIDLVRALASNRAVSAGALAREALTVPETLRADDLLAAMRLRGAREAVVIDEYGGTAGLVTFEGLMERIVGDLGAFGTGGGRIAVREDGSADIDGLTLVADLNDQFDLHIDEATFTTVGGYVLGRLGRRPRVGDAVEVENRQMRVEGIDGLRVARVWLSAPLTESSRQDCSPARRPTRSGRTEVLHYDRTRSAGLQPCRPPSAPAVSPRAAAATHSRRQSPTRRCRRRPPSTASRRP